MRTVSSVSGGKTSSYMALKYPTDYYVFACVLVNDPRSAPRDPALLKQCKDRIPGFVASLEDEKTLKIILDLEQEIQKPIKWVSAEFPLESYVEGTTDLPGYRSGKLRLFNSLTRFCTVQQKILPIAEWVYSFVDSVDPVLMNIGFRYDEPHRVENWNCKNDKLRRSVSCPINGGNWKYAETDWRVSAFPLYSDRITNIVIKDFWKNKNWDFPEISNCRFCPLHSDVQLQRQAIEHPDTLNWWLDLESKTSHSFGKRKLADRINQPLLDVFDRPCQCTD